MNNGHKVRRVVSRWRRVCRAGLLACGTLASYGLVAAPLWAEPNTYRSVKDVQQWVPDGSWEVREGPLAVATNTSQADARWAAAEVAKAQAQTTKLIGHFAPTRRTAEIPPASLQIAIDGKPRLGRGAAATTINVVGIQTQVEINVSPGQPALKEQLGRLREGAAFAVLHATELDAALPPAVVVGLAAHIGHQGTGASRAAPEASPQLIELLGGEQWRWRQAAPGQRQQPRELTSAAQRASFLIAGNDAAHAPEALAALASALERTVVRTEGTNQGIGRATQQSLGQTQAQLDMLTATHHADFDAWLKDPLVGQPEFAPDEKSPADVVSQEREMLVVLKLQRRLSSERPAAATVKIATFDREKGRQLVGATGDRKPISPAEISGRLADPAQPPMATLDADGSLLLSTDRERINRLFGEGGQRYQLERQENQWQLTTRLSDGRLLRGYLADNPDKPSRPLAKFTIDGPVAAGGKPKPKGAAKPGDAAANER